jgi:hypothetical protein
MNYKVESSILGITLRSTVGFTACCIIGIS